MMVLKKEEGGRVYIDTIRLAYLLKTRRCRRAFNRHSVLALAEVHFRLGFRVQTLHRDVNN